MLVPGRFLAAPLPEECVTATGFPGNRIARISFLHVNKIHFQQLHKNVLKIYVSSIFKGMTLQCGHAYTTTDHYKRNFFLSVPIQNTYSISKAFDSYSVSGGESTSPMKKLRGHIWLVYMA